MECHSKCNVTQNDISLKMECHSNLNVTKNRMSLKMECHLKRNIIQKAFSLKMECHSKWNMKFSLARLGINIFFFKLSLALALHKVRFTS